MQTPTQNLNRELTALRAAVAVLLQLDGPAAKGPYLVEQLKKEPTLAKYFYHLATAPAADAAPLALAREIPNLPAPAAAIARQICDRTLQIGCTPTLVLKALERAGMGKVYGLPLDKATPAADATILIRLATPVGDSCAAALLVDGRPAANISFRAGPRMLEAISRLKAMGVLFEGDRQ